MLDNKDFNQKLRNFISSTSTQRDNLQALIVSGLSQVEAEQGNTVQLGTLLNACVGVKSLPTKAIKDYIKAHVTNRKWSKNKDGNLVFSKEKKGVDCVVTAPTGAWYNNVSAKKAQATPDYDAVARAKALLTNLSKAIKDGTVKDADEAAKIKAALSVALGA